MVKDFDTKLGTIVKCAKSDTWNPATTEIVTATQVDDNTIKFTAPEGSKTCITYPPEQVKVPEGQTSVTNHAEVNGLKLEATATIRSNGGTDGNGSVKPTPAPAPVPSEDPKPTPSDEPQSTPSPKPSETTAPTTVEQKSAPAPEAKLAQTGATFDGIVIALVTVLVGIAACVVAWRAGRFGNDYI